MSRVLLAAACVSGAIAGPALAMDPAAKPTPVMIVNQLTPYLEQKLDKGEVVVLVKQRHPVYDLDVFGDIDGTREQVWSAVTSYAQYKDFLPLVTDSALRKREGNRFHQYVKMNPPWPFQEHWMINVNVENKAAWRVSWDEADGSVRYEKGFWEITQGAGTKTRLRYHLTVDPWMDTMPGWVVEMVTKTIMPAVINGVRKRVKTVQDARR
jgi:ribosome-associated toxin RatA of RatAB toxin-antitoxin module